jgi:hypothetical protein
MIGQGIEIQKQEGVVTLLSDKADFNSKLVRKKRSLCIDKGSSPSRRYNSVNYICTEY